MRFGRKTSRSEKGPLWKGSIAFLLLTASGFCWVKHFQGAKKESQNKAKGEEKKITEKTDVVSGERRKQRLEGKEVK